MLTKEDTVNLIENARICDNRQFRAKRDVMQLLNQPGGRLEIENDLHQCMESLIKIAVLLEQACDNTAQHPGLSREEGLPFDTFNTRSITNSALGHSTQSFHTAHIQLRDVVSSMCHQLENLMLRFCYSDEVVWKEDVSKMMRLSFRRPSPRLEPQANTNVFKTLSAASGSQQILVSTTGCAIYAQNVINGSQSKQILGQMSDLSLKASMER